MRAIIAGGGTGGHFFPGLAVAQEIVASGGSVAFIGSDDGIEARVAPRHDFEFVPVRMRAFRGGGIAGVARSLLRLFPSLLTGWRALRRLRPDIVIGLGSYGSVPVVLAARVRRVPVVLMEQNVVPGFANRLLGRFAQRICTTYVESAAYFPRQRCVQTGNPVRTLATQRRPEVGCFTVFAFGGSQGARSINRAMVDAAERLQTRVPGLRVLHQTGSADVEATASAYRAKGIDAEVHAFIDDMGSAYGAADIVVARAGATTLAEIAALGKPAILIPYPIAADDHQRKNADVVVRRGGARMILDRDLTGEALADAIAELARDGEARRRMAEAIRELAIPDAVQKVLTVCRDVVDGKVE